MIQNLIMKRGNIQLTLIFSFFSVFFAFKSGIILYIDSYGYIDNHIVRSAIYPLFLDLLSDQKNFSVAIFVQMALTVFALVYFAKTRKFIFENHLIYFGYIVFSCIIIANFWNAVISEALAIPIFILFLSKFLEIIDSSERLSIKNFIVLIVFVTVLISIRNQFIFLIPTLAVWLFLSKTPKKWLYTLALLIPLLLNTLVDRYYHLVKHNHFIATPYTGMQILPSVLFQSNLSDSVIFEDKQERKDFVFLKTQLLNKYIDHQKMDTLLGNSPQYLYTLYFDVIAHRTIKPYFLDQLKSLNLNDQYVQLDQKGKHMFFLLFKRNIKQNIVFYFNLLRLNGYNNWLIFIMSVFVLIFSLIQYFKKRDIIFLLVFIALFALLLNQSLVTIVNIIGYRYVVYNYIFIFYLLLLVLHTTLQKSKIN